MWQNRLKEIIYILENSKVNEIEITFWGRRIRVAKKPNVVTGTPKSDDTHVIGTDDQSDSDQHSHQHEVATIKETNGETILSPMPGSFYSTPAPDAKPFVAEGDSVSKGDTLCIIEAMKIMNEIEAEKGGIIKQILVNNGDPVEYNQPLFVLE
jgi:acetyl-CoA carboxylase biotin carboxyl carrier protein